MPEIIGNIAQGFLSLLTFANLASCLVGVYLGLASGLLTGVNAVVLMGIAVPITFIASPLTSMVLLVSIFNGAQYGASIKAIVTSADDTGAGGLSSRDGRRMAWQGHAGRALTGTLLASLGGTIIAAIFIAVMAPTLARFGLGLGPPEMFSGIALALLTTVIVSPGALTSNLAVLSLGLLLGLVGLDFETGAPRMTFGLLELLAGVSVVPMVIGLFALGEMIATLETGGRRGLVMRNFASFRLTREDSGRMLLPTLRGGAIGSVLGLLPGGGPALATYGAYVIEGLFGKRGGELGQGIIEGVAAPTAANMAGTQTSFVTLMTLGIPTGPAIAMLLAALSIHGVVAGPEMAVKQPQLFWGMLAALWLGTLVLLAIYLPLMRLWINLVEVPFRWLFPAVLGLSVMCVHATANSAADIAVMAAFGLLGYVLRKLDCNSTPLLLGFVLAPALETAFRQSLKLSGSSYSIFLSRPLSATFLVVAVLLLAVHLASRVLAPAAQE